MQTENPPTPPVARSTWFWLAALSLVYFVVFVFPNARGAENMEALRWTSGDEFVTIPIVQRMLQPSASISEAWGRLIIYGDYHYGYPFYFFSYAAALPLRLAGEVSLPALMLTLRQVINVLPVMFTALILAYLQTGFRRAASALALYAWILLIPAVVRQNIQWWHPDALCVLFVALTLFFIARDRLRFGLNFYLAAAACGLAAGAKMAGFFFFLAIPAVLLAGWWSKRLTPRRAALSAVLFVLVMGGSILASNPFLFYRAPRERMIAIQQFKSQELSQGYAHDAPDAYQKGPRFWVATLQNMYGPVPYLLFLALALGVAAWAGPNAAYHRLLLAWCLPYTLYLLYWVAPKPDHYWLPVLIPLSSVVFTLPARLWSAARAPATPPARRWLAAAGLGLTVCGLAWVAVWALQKDAALWLAAVTPPV